MEGESPARQLTRFLAKYTPAIASTAKRALTKVRALIPGAVELVYDNYNALVIAFGPTERTSGLIVSIALYPRWVTLFFANGKDLPDPHRLLEGSGKFVRHIVLESAADLDRAPVRALVREAVRRGANQPQRGARRRMIIQSISKKQRPRRPRTA